MTTLLKLRTQTLAIGALGLGVAACAAVLGIGDRTLDTDGGPTTADGGPGGDSGPCGNTQTDTHNCGRCGHDCLGGMCTAGVCQPITLASSITPWSIAVDATSVYWTSDVDHDVRKASKIDGTSPITLMDANDPQGRVIFPFDIVLSGTSAYVSDQGSAMVLSCAVGGCGDNPQTVAAFDAGSGNATVLKLAVDSEYVYWTDGAASIWRAPKSGGGPVRLLGTYDPDDPNTPSGMSTPYALVVDTMFVYFTNDDGTVQKVPLAGGSVSKVAAGMEGSGIIALANGLLYWSQDPPTTGASGTVNSVPTTGGSLKVIATGQVNPLGLAVDANNIYWVDFGTNVNGGDGTVQMCALANCSAPTTLATNQNTPKAITVDTTAIYWTDYGSGTNDDGAVMKLALP
jgi:hypothetical protein